MSRIIPRSVSIRRDVVYRDDLDEPLAYDIYFHPQSDEPTALVVFIHGGAWHSGDRSWCKAALHLLNRGVAMASISYRLAQIATFPAQIIDCKAAIRALRSRCTRYNIDGKRIGLWGESAGGHLAALAATSAQIDDWDRHGAYIDQSSAVQACCDWCGPIDLAALGAHYRACGMDRQPDPHKPNTFLFGTPLAETEATKLARADPRSYLSYRCPPFLIVHGDSDEVVPIDQSRQFHESLVASGVPSELVTIPGIGHKLTRDIPANQLNSCLDFFCERLGPTHKPELPWSAPFTSTCPGLGYRSFPSTRIDTDYGLTVLHPPGYDSQPARRYPVIYFLHGSGARQSYATPLLRRYQAAMAEGRMPPHLIICPNGLSGSLWDDDAAGEKPVASLFIKEVIPYVDRHYRSIAERSGRELLGFSMGGFGTLHLAPRHPELFGRITALAAALHSPAFLRDHRKPAYRAVYGGDYQRCHNRSPWTLWQTADIPDDLQIRLLCGDRDELLGKNLLFSQLLSERDIRHSMELIPRAEHSATRLIDHYPGDYFTASGQNADNARRMS